MTINDPAVHEILTNWKATSSTPGVITLAKGETYSHVTGRTIAYQIGIGAVHDSDTIEAAITVLSRKAFEHDQKAAKAGGDTFHVLSSCTVTLWALVDELRKAA